MCSTTSKRGKWGVVRGAEHAGGETPLPGFSFRSINEQEDPPWAEILAGKPHNSASEFLGYTPPDRTVGPAHYTEMAIQPWEVMEACMPRAEFLGYLRGNAIKYLMRADRKGGVEDYRKAKHYLEKLVSVITE